jgi:hypothetical protein
MFTRIAVVVFLLEFLWLILIARKIEMSTTPGLTALQAFVTAFQAFVTQQTTDLANLTTAINNAIAALGNSSASEDPQVAAAVGTLESALASVTTNEEALEALNTSLETAENPAPPAGGSVASAAAKVPTPKSS